MARGPQGPRVSTLDKRHGQSQGCYALLLMDEILHHVAEGL